MRRGRGSKISCRAHVWRRLRGPSGIVAFRTRFRTRPLARGIRLLDLLSFICVLSKPLVMGSLDRRGIRNPIVHLREFLFLLVLVINVPLQMGFSTKALATVWVRAFMVSAVIAPMMTVK
jgi:hypothetical protein